MNQHYSLFVAGNYDALDEVTLCHEEERNGQEQGHDGGCLDELRLRRVNAVEEGEPYCNRYFCACASKVNQRAEEVVPCEEEVEQ